MQYRYSFEKLYQVKKQNSIQVKIRKMTFYCSSILPWFKKIIFTSKDKFYYNVHEQCICIKCIGIMLTQILDILECTYFPMLIICINVWFGYQHTCCIDLICSIWHWRELMGSSIFLKLSVLNKWHHWNNLHSYTCSCIQFLAKKNRSEVQPQYILHKKNFRIKM